ncbi:acetyl-CoA acetyltransferase [Burkholderia thailandensis]|uniref:Uncharacterized protein n=1 Tax=Burkholderia thailandensis TaxID=57975 RepID=A0AAW9CNY2_BURTH|nr:acetyl-CoA acetyltransferase [Burkholderia thailandensis]AOI55621.1 acetyl-CoA acetyltransferase [Burkholderia thailandensis]AOJ48904.1 acetyl-CoA acetyltransferase [Burkholderia thailandensis]AOJ54581.1 acetyl-CoA acetyltransferase [Burkholderia thailandensis]AOJ60541.1 acetyl-CoA acetyltransferase [Burkholderia thailandensis]
MTRRGGARAARRNAGRMPATAMPRVRVVDGFTTPMIDAALFGGARRHNAPG